MRRAVGVLLGAATLGAVGWCLAPILWQLLTSLKPEAELYLAPPAWFPAAPAAAHYRAVLADGRFVRSVLNSAIIAGDPRPKAMAVDRRPPSPWPASGPAARPSSWAYSWPRRCSRPSPP